MSKIIYTTGLTGFIGQCVLKKIVNKYDVIVNFGRDKKMTFYRPALEPLYKDFNLNELEAYPSETLVHIAGYYNLNPNSLGEKNQLEESNYNFPFSLCNLLKKNGLKKIISTSSYMQLIDLEGQSFYSETKNKFISWAKSEFEVSEIFLFDTFGPNDQRKKVLDVFIQNAIFNYDINIPLIRVDINLTHVEEVAKCLVDSIKLMPGQYMIKSNNQTTVKELAIDIISLNKTTSQIKTELEGSNFFKNINSFPQNIYQKTLDSDFHEQIQERYNEIQQTSYL